MGLGVGVQREREEDAVRVGRGVKWEGNGEFSKEMWRLKVDRDRLPHCDSPFFFSLSILGLLATPSPPGRCTR